MSEDISWHLLRLKAMSGPDVYDMLALRQAVFMLEQSIPVLDADGRDIDALHLCGRGAEGLLAYARIFAPGEDHDEVKIGRVVVAASVRGQGLGRELMEQALDCAADLAPDAPVLVSAQAHLAAFYESLGFTVDGEIYDDHGVPHVDMVRYPPEDDREEEDLADGPISEA
ncbi:acetyltransferase [Terrihabitans soli]|uniref:Acetyltransferase n=1 Tax=Terrihabitans soli TaxID=708113 RepID=A0A6S6QRN7_9HYPH|nr:GNAT family N-acetyltransferase [Terrihabitans soli]BCJ89550.1 acetyltransferase [Terrihabitans soli]